MTKQIFALLVLIVSAGSAFGQTKVGEQWVDNNLAFEIIYDDVRTKGRIDICIVDTSRATSCIENLQSGFEVKVYDASDKMIWEGIGSGRTSALMLPNPLPQAKYVTIKAFKPYVTNKSTGTRIHQEQPIEIKYTVR